MAFFTFNKRKVFYRISGQGEPLLLLHGNTVFSCLFSTVLKKYCKEFQVILVDFPGHGKSERVDRFETDFWFYNSKAVYSLIEHLGLEKVTVIGTSGGALVALNLALEHPDRIRYVFADSFEGAYPLPSYIKSLKADREKDKKKLLAKLFWFYSHGFHWKKIVDLDTDVNIEFAKTGNSFFHKSISDLNVPTLLTGSMKDEYCDHLDKIYGDLQKKNNRLEIHLFDQGNHPAMLSNKDEFFVIVKEKTKTTTRA